MRPVAGPRCGLSIVPGSGPELPALGALVTVTVGGTKGHEKERGWGASQEAADSPAGCLPLLSVLSPCPNSVLCFPAVPADQTPTANARLNLPSEHCAGRPATRNLWGDPASPQEVEARNGFMVLTSADNVHNVKFPQFLGEALSPFLPPRPLNFANYCKSK